MDLHEIARVMGQRGGRTRARRLPAERRREIAALGGHARRESLLVTRRIVETLRYAAAAEELRGGRPPVRRAGSVRGPLPGLYPDRS